MTDRLLVTVPNETLRTALGTMPDGAEVALWDFSTEPPAPHIDLVVPPYMGSAEAIRALATVTSRLVQSQSIGYDGVVDRLPPGIVFANAASVHETSTAELAVALILAAQRGIPDFVRAAEHSHWAPATHASLADRRVLIIGAGGIGRAIADRLASFEVEITRVASTARDDDRGRVHGSDELPSLLPNAEIVVVAVPLTDSTDRLVDAPFLAALPDGALVVNISRGQIADTDAIVAEAQSGRLRFALDVVDPEPLPERHPLWGMPNVLIAPHVGGASSAMMPRMVALIRDQIERMLRGDEPRNVVART